MEGSKAQLGAEASKGWADPFMQALKTFVVAFVVLQAKEWLDAGQLDTPATAVDAALIAGGVFLVNAVQKLVKA